MAQTQKSKTTKAPQSDQAKPEQTRPTGRTAGNWLWGGLFVLAGGLFLLSNLGVVSLVWGDIWRMWPVVIIVAGLSILKLQGKWAVLVYSLAAVLIASLIWLTLTGSLTSQQSAVVSDQFEVSRSGSKIDKAIVNIQTGASDLNITSHDKDQLIWGKVDSRVSDLKYDSRVDGSTQIVTLSREGSWSLFGGGSFNRFDIELGQLLPTELIVDAGASSIDADLSSIMLRSVVIDSGASSIKLRLGDKLESTDVEIDTGVSSVTIYVPKDSGVELKLDTGLSSQQLPSGYVETSEDTYRSADYEAATKKIAIDVDMGVSSFKLVTY